MKKLFTILSLFAAVIFTSCDNDNSVNPQPTGKAVITGKVLLETNDNTAGEETLPNRKIIVTIYGDESQRYEEILSDAEGNFRFELEVGSEPLEVVMHLTDFRTEVTVGTTKTSEIFYGEGFHLEGYDVEVEKGGEYIRNIVYNY